MKKMGITALFVLISTVASAQFYMSGSGGYSLEMAEKKLGDNISSTGKSDLKGSYGAGTHIQLRGGYLFNEKFGVELGLGYLHGADQDVTKITGIPTLPEADIVARGRAFGASLSGVYNVTENIYVRAGLLTKVGGKTQAEGKVSTKLPVALLNPTITDPTILGDLNAEFTTDFKGKLPFGAIAAAGYKYPISDKLSIFAEVEYMGINVTRDKSNLKDFSATFAGQAVTRDQVVAGMTALIASPTTPAGTKQTVAQFLPLLADEAKWGEGALPSSKAPYSSLGFNIGITFNLGGGSSSSSK